MLQYGGQQRGFFSLPDPETIIAFCFAYASPKLIMIRGVIPWGMKLPPYPGSPEKPTGTLTPMSGRVTT